MGTLTRQWADIQKDPSPKQIKNSDIADVAGNWGYFRPIAEGIVRFTKTEYDAMPPAAVRKINTALDMQGQKESKIIEELKRTAGLKNG